MVTSAPAQALREVTFDRRTVGDQPCVLVEFSRSNAYYAS
jgi:hypothetical protein